MDGGEGVGVSVRDSGGTVVSQAISTRLPEVTIEYDCRGHRVTRHFVNAWEGRSFYVAKSKAGKNPKVVKEEKDG